MNITGTTVFVPVDITHEDWDMILEDLSTAPPRGTLSQPNGQAW
jgi:hypothetical protein